MTRTSSILSSGNQSPRKATPRSRSSSSKPHENATTKPDDTMPTTSSAEKPDSPSHQHSFIDTGPRNTLSSTNLDAQLQSLLQEKELVSPPPKKSACGLTRPCFFFSYKLNIAKSRSVAEMLFVDDGGKTWNPGLMKLTPRCEKLDYGSSVDIKKDTFN